MDFTPPDCVAEYCAASQACERPAAEAILRRTRRSSTPRA